MDRHPDISAVLIHDRIVDLFATASHARRTTVSIWRRLAGAALVRLGTAILGEPLTTSSSVPLKAASLSR